MLNDLSLSLLCVQCSHAVRSQQQQHPSKTTAFSRGDRVRKQTPHTTQSSRSTTHVRVGRLRCSVLAVAVSYPIIIGQCPQSTHLSTPNSDSSCRTK